MIEIKHKITGEIIFTYEGADLRYCIGNNNEVKSLQLGTYLISFCGQTLNISCQSHTIEDWGNFTDKEISDMDSNALDWWKLNKSIILEVVKRN